LNMSIEGVYLYDGHYTLILNGDNRGVELENIPLEVLDRLYLSVYQNKLGVHLSLQTLLPKKNTPARGVFFFCLWGIEPI